MSKNIEAYKRSALVVYKLIETLKRLQLANPQMGWHGRHREDNVIRAWKYGKTYGK